MQIAGRKQSMETDILIYSRPTIFHSSKILAEGTSLVGREEMLVKL